MALKVQCEQCGKVSQFSQSDAGVTALCVACGARFTIPSAPDETLIPDAALIDAAPGESLADFVPAETLPMAATTLEATAPAVTAEPPSAAPVQPIVEPIAADKRG